MKKRHMKVIRVTKTEFELEDGRVIPHVADLDFEPSVEDFQKHLDEWYEKMPVPNKETEDDG